MEQSNGEKIIEILIKEERPSRIAFLPYLKEMWDSMESVYLAARARGIDAKIIPLEYDVLDEQRRILDTRLDFEHTEDFDPTEYDLVVIHYPYDDRNKVTRLHNERYFAPNIAKQTKVVYIPYFCGESTIDFKLKPGPVSASYIFCDTWHDFKEFKDLFPHKRVFLVGSPKMDKLTDEAGDHILVVNSLVPFLQAGEYRLDEYRDIIYSHENVIYRPHPLMIDALRAMHPMLLIPYAQFLHELQREGIEIDSVPDVSETFKRCNYMYADGGSLVTMWKETGKPYQII